MANLSPLSQYTLVTCLALAPFASASLLRAELPYPIGWSTQFGTTGTELASGVCTDSSGNVFTTGLTNGNLAAVNAGNSDVFLAKYGPTGSQLWITQFGTTAEEGGRAVTADLSGNVFVVGQSGGTLGGTNLGGLDAFLAKYSPSGALVWKRQFGGNLDDYALDVKSDSAGNLYVSGASESNFATGFAGSLDAFVVKYDNNGNEIWRRETGSTGRDYGFGIAVDSAANVYLTGSTTGAYAGANAGNTDMILTKYNSAGTLLWKKQIGTSAHDDSESVATDSSGFIYITGTTSGALGGPNAGGQDNYLAKYDSLGNQLWQRHSGTSALDGSAGIAIDSADNIFTTGFTQGSLAGTNIGGYDMLLAKYDVLGNQIWATQFGTIDDEATYSIATDSRGYVFVSGATAGSLAGPNTGSLDNYLAEFVAPEPASLTLLALGSLTLLSRRRKFPT